MAKTPLAQEAAVTVGPRVISFEMIAAITQHAINLARALRALTAIVAQPGHVESGFPSHALFELARQHAAALERAFNPERHSFEALARTVVRVPPAAIDGGFGWMMQAFNALIHTLDWQRLCTHRTPTGRRSSAEPLGQGELRRLQQIQEATLDALEIAGAGLGNGVRQVMADAASGPQGAPTPQQIEALRMAIQQVGREAKPSVIYGCVPMRRTVAVLGLRMLEAKGEYTGFSRRCNPVQQLRVEAILRSRSQ